MAITYVCKHCKTHIGSLDSHRFHLDSINWQLLSAEQQQQLIHSQHQDITFHVICEYCQELLEQHPQYHELDHFIQ